MSFLTVLGGLWWGGFGGSGIHIIGITVAGGLKFASDGHHFRIF
jgi:hypothetical protein